MVNPNKIKRILANEIFLNNGAKKFIILLIILFENTSNTGLALRKIIQKTNKMSKGTSEF